MACQAAKEPLLSAVEEAMLGDLGDRRIDTLPMDDGRFSHHAAPLRNSPYTQGGPTNKWKRAIADGAFNDDDAMQVAGMDTIADGQLARMHRAGRIAGMIVTAGYNDQYLSRNHNGQIDPRAKFQRGQRGPSMTGRAHQGDGPIQTRHMLSNSRHAPTPPAVSQRPGETPDSRAHTARPPRPLPPQPKNRPEASSQPGVLHTKGDGPQTQQSHRAKSTRFALPDGASIVFETSVELASPTFTDRNARYPGIVYLIAGDSPTSDQIILGVDDEGIEDVKHFPKDYGNLVTQSQEVILQFKSETGRTSWYVVRFSQRDAMAAFVDALRKFVDRPSETPLASPTAAATAQGREVVNQSNNEAISTDIPPSTDAVCPPQPVQSTQLHAPAQVHAAPVAIISSQGIAVPANLIKDIVSWVINIVDFIKESGPAELGSFDALPGVIRGATAAVLLSRHSDFAKLDQQQRVAYIDNCCAPQVFEMFKHRLREQAEQKQPTQVQTATPQDQSFQKVQESKPSTATRVVYTAEELVRMRSMARPPPHWLAELGFLKEAVRSTHQQVRAPGLQRDQTHDASISDHKRQIQQVASNANWLHGGRTQVSSRPSSCYRDEIIGLFVSNVASDAEVRAMLTEEDRAKIIAIKQWNPMSMVVMFKTTEDRDEALQRVAGEFKIRTRSKPLVEVFQRRERTDTNSTHSASDRSRSRETHQITSPVRGYSTRTPSGASEAADSVGAANGRDAGVGSFRVQTPQTTSYGIDGHNSPNHGPSSISEGSGPNRVALTSTSSSPPPAITVTAPSEQGTTADGSRAEANVAAQSSPSLDTMGTDHEGPLVAVPDGHSGLNASRFNPDNVDLLGENSGAWTGALAQNKSYMHDLQSILWTEDFEITGTNDSETVSSYAAKNFK